MLGRCASKGARAGHNLDGGETGLAFAWSFDLFFYSASTPKVFVALLRDSDCLGSMQPLYDPRNRIV